MPALPSRIAKLLTIQAVAEKLDLSGKTIRRMIARGELPVHRIGRAVRVSEQDLELFLVRARQ